MWQIGVVSTLQSLPETGKPYQTYNLMQQIEASETREVLYS